MIKGERLQRRSHKLLLVVLKFIPMITALCYLLNYDSVFVANMCKADFLGSSVPDERRLVMYIRDVIDDVDAYDGIVFNRWYADMCYTGVAIDWEEML